MQEGERVQRRVWTTFEERMTQAMDIDGERERLHERGWTTNKNPNLVWERNIGEGWCARRRKDLSTRSPNLVGWSCP